jgi:8-oxo-dGTP pyrophosphatase MutT (NUDIX family)
MSSAASATISSLARRLASHRPRAENDAALLWAAVALIVVPNPAALLLIRRAEHPGDPWSGHMALPGGRRSPTDITLCDTAMRESLEEVGVQLEPSQCIGTLDDVAPRTPVLPPIAVRPYVFALPNRPSLIPNPEVASTHWIPLETLLHPDTYRPVHVDIRGEQRTVDAFLLENAVVWGMTERILTSLLQHLR